MAEHSSGGTRKNRVRRFLGRAEAVIPHAARLLIDASHDPGSPGPLDLRDRTILLPGARGGRLLREALIAEAARHGCGVLLPTIVTPRALRERVHPDESVLGGDTPLLPASPSATRLAFYAAVRDLPAAARAGLLPAAVEAPTSAGHERAVARIAGRLDALAGELAEEGRTIDDLAEVIAGLEGGAEKTRLEVFARVARDAGGRLEASGLVAAFLHPPSEAIIDPGPVIAIGLADPRPRVRAILEHLDDLEVWIHADETEAATFDAIGARIIAPAPETGPAFSSPAAGLPPLSQRFPDDRFIVCEHAVEEAETVRRRILEERARGRTPTVCILDRETHALIVDRLERSGIAVHSGAGRSALLTPPGRWVEALLAWLDEPDAASLAALLRHPDVEAPLSAALLAEDPDEAGGERTEKKRRRRPPESLLPRLDAARSRSLAATLEALPDRERAVRDPILAATALWHEPERPIDGWIATITAESDRIFATCPEEQLVPLHAALDEIGTLDPALAGPVPATVPLRLLAARLAASATPRRGDDAAVEVVGWLEVELDPADELIVVGANEGLLPGRGAGHDPLLTPRLRRSLHLPDDLHRAHRDAALVDTLLASPRSVTWIAGRRTREGEPRHPTRFWLADDATRAPRVAHFYGEQERRPTIEIALPRRDAGPPLTLPEPIPLVDPPTSASVTDFAAYLACPYSYSLDRLGRRRELHDHWDELEPTEFGNRLHAALETFANLPSARTLDDEEAVRKLLEDCLARTMATEHGSAPSAVVQIQQEQMRERLEKFARWQAQTVRDGWRIVAAEVQIPHDTPNFTARLPEGATVSGGAPGNEIAFTIRGTIDRIDHHPEHGFRLIDYKTGERGDDPEKVHRIGRGETREWKSLQLPLYRHFAPTLPLSVAIEEDASIEVAFVNLPRDPAAETYRRAEWSATEHAEAIELARHVAGCIHDQRFWPPRRLRAPWDFYFGGEREIGRAERLFALGQAGLEEGGSER